MLTAAPHPQADKLQVLTVDAGTGEAIQVVCGAPNARAGLKGVFGAPGAYVPGSDLTLKVAAIRGVESRGMLCSVRELELGDEHDGIIALPEDAPVGANYATWAGLDDPVIEVAVTPNRQDAMGVHGIARDLAAAGLGTLKPVDAPDIAGTYPCPTEIRTDDPEGCPAFYGRVIRGVKNGPSPGWLQQRLKAIGQRPISALVDMTNFITISYGRPLHVYDLAMLEGAIVARRARDGEQVLALNGKSYALDPSMTVIADDREVHDIGGIMGGEHSGVADGTTDILIECAYFTPEHIALTGQKLGLASDARTRFERGVDPQFLEAGLQLATKMAIELAGGEPSQVIRAGTPPQARQGRRLRSGPLRGAGRNRRARGPAAGHPPAARLHCDARHDLASRGAVMASRRGRGGRPGRGGRADRGDGRGALDAAAARAGRRACDRDARAADRADRAADGGGARAERGGDLELHRRGRVRAVRRRGLAARQPDQRGDEGDAALAAAGPAGGGGAECGAGHRRRCACSKSGGAIWRMASGRPWGWC